MTSFRWMASLSMGALLVLSGCSSSNLKDERDQLRAENERLRATPTVDPQTEQMLREAEAALAELRGLLDAQASLLLAPGAPSGQREEVLETVADAQANLTRVLMALETQPDSAAKTAANEALAAVGAALTAVGGALQASAPAASVGLAQAAVDDAQAKLNAALAAGPGPALANLLTQAQATFSTAQLSLVPLLREQWAESENAQQAAEAALAELRSVLAEAQVSLEPGAPAEQREEARGAVASAQDNLARVRMTLETQPDSAAKTAANEALAAVGAALTAVDEALRHAAPAASAGLLVFAEMHTTLDRAQAAVDDAQAKLKEALAADPGPTLSNLLTQAQATLSTAQITLIPLLREEVAGSESARRAAEGQRDEAQAARQAAEEDLAARRTLTLPDGLTAADAGDPGEFIVEAGRRTIRAGVGFSCPAGGEACRVRVYGNGEIGYWGGTPTAWPYPARSALWEDLEPGVWRQAALGEVSVRRVPRLDEAQTAANPDPLEIATEGVAWAAGKTITKPTGELPLRVLTLRGGLDKQGDEWLVDTYPRWHNDDAKLVSSIELREDGGVVLKVGGTPGEGLIYGDMDIDPNLSSVAGPDGKSGTVPTSDDPPREGDPMKLHNALDLGFSAEEAIRLVEAREPLTQDQVDELSGYRLDNCDHPDLPGSGAGLCHDAGTADLEITFGKSSSGVPAGDAAVGWSARVPFEDPDAVIDADYAFIHYDQLVSTGGRHRTYHDYGRYDLFLSKYAGLDPGADDDSTALDPGADPDSLADDTHRYLEYAAYGLFHFFDNRLVNPRTARVHGFHFGFDAFRDADLARPSDRLPDAIQTTFKGKMMGWDLRSASERNARYYRDFAGNSARVGEIVRIRGDVTLDACIGGSGAGVCPDGTKDYRNDLILAGRNNQPLPTTANTIYGVLNNFEFYSPETDHWWFFHADDLSSIELRGAVEDEGGGRHFSRRFARIEADGSFHGLAVGHPTDRWYPVHRPSSPPGEQYAVHYGEHSGTLYGPPEDLEVAGWFRVIPGPGSVEPDGGAIQSKGLIGSYGAKCTEGCD